MAKPQPIVLKLGGSLCETGKLADVIALVAASRRPLVIVPGGGPFADAVRALQQDQGFDDATAHGLALLALNETAKMMFALAPDRLAPAETLAEIEGVLAGGRIPVWLPYKLSVGDEAIPHDWSATSDALAARLAERLGGLAVVLVKSADAPFGLKPQAHADSGLVDPVFPQIVERAGLPWGILGPGGRTHLAELLGVAAAPAA